MLSCSNAATFVLRVEAVWLGAPPGVELTFTWPPGNSGCCWHRTFFGSAYQLRFSRVTTGGAAIYCNSFPQWNAPELSIFAAFGNFCRWKVTVVSSVWPSFTRLCAKHANQTYNCPWQLKSPGSKRIWCYLSWHFDQAYLPGWGANCDHLGSSPRARLLHCTEELVDPCDFPKCGKLDITISVSGDLRSR